MLKELIGLLDTHHLNEIEYRSVFKKIRIVKNDQPNGRGGHPCHDYHTAVTAENSVIPVSVAISTGKTPDVIDPEVSEFFIIRSPMVGTFYWAPAPGSLPFVKLYDHVNCGSVVCIIEAMKLMNEIESDVSGTIVKIAVTNESMVEVNQPLFYIKPD